MAGAGEMLVLAGRSVTDEFSDHFAPEVLSTFDDPYEALAAMGPNDWSNVVIGASYVGLSGLCRAVRKLQRTARVIVLCGPAMESEVRDLTRGVPSESIIDDYFIYPLTNDDWRKLTPACQDAENPRNAGN